MANWSIFSFEAVMFVSILYLYMQIRKSKVPSIIPVQGLTTYVPPVDEDYEMLEKTNKGARENKKGEVNKYDKKKLPAKAKFPLRTLEINEDFLKHNQEFFVEYDFLFMLFTVILLLFVFTSLTKIFLPGMLETNVIFYMMIFLILMTLMNLGKNTFANGYFNLSDETRIEFLFAMKAFISTFIVMSSLKSTTFFDFDMEKAHEETMKRVNQLMYILGGKLDLPIIYMYFALGLFAALITFFTVRLHIRFAYYFYVITKNKEQLFKSKGENSEEGARYRKHLYLMYLNLLAPLIVLIFYV